MMDFFETQVSYYVLYLIGVLMFIVGAVLIILDLRGKFTSSQDPDMIGSTGQEDPPNEGTMYGKPTNERSHDRNR